MQIRVRRIVLSLAAVSAPLMYAQTSVLTYHNNSLRTGWNANESLLTPASVASGRFGPIAKVSVDGQVDAQPLVVANQLIQGQGVHDVLYVVTAANSVWALDAKTGAVLIKTTVGAPVPQALLPGSCNNNASTVGITSTPVIDTGTGEVYVMAYVLPQTQIPQYQLHALDLGTLQEHAGSPVVVQASQRLTTGGTFVFDARYQRQRPALLESNGRIYAGFGSFCDFAPDKSRGWLLSWDAKTLAPSSNTEIINRQVYSGGQSGVVPMYLSSIWMSGFGPAADASGDIYFATGNTQSGKYDSAFNLSESVVRLSGDLGQVVGTFTPSVVNTLDAYDLDFGAGGVMLLPDQKLGNGLFPHLAVVGGKDGSMFLLNRDNLGRLQVPNVPSSSYIGQCWCGPSYFETPSGPRIVSSGGTTLTEWTPSITWNNTPGLRQVASSSAAVENPKVPAGSSTGHDYGFFTSVSSNGVTANTAVIWAVGRNYGTGSVPLTLRAFAEPSAGLGTSAVPPLLALWSGVAGSWSSPNANPNIVPTVANGRVYVASDRQVMIFGLK